MNRSSLSSLGALVLSLTALIPLYGQDVETLRAGAPAEGTLPFEAVHQLELRLAAGEFAEITMRPAGARLELSVFDDAGELVIRRRQLPDNPERRYWLLADRDASFRIELRNRSVTDTEGAYRLLVRELRAATEADRKRLRAQAIHFEASREFSKATAESRPLAIAKYEEVLPLWRELGDDALLVEAIYHIGFANYFVKGPRGSLESFEAAIEVYRELGDRVGEARTLDNVGLIRFNLGEPRAALDIFESSLPIWREVGHRQGEANALLSIGLVKENLRDVDAAARYYADALAIQREIGDERGQGIALNNLAHVYHGVGNAERALEAYLESLELRRSLEDVEGEAVTLNNIALVLFDLGDLERATSTFDEALELRRKAGDRRGEAVTLQSAGFAWRQIGKLDDAREAYEASLAIATELDNPRLETGVHTALGTLYAVMGDDERAERSYELGLAGARGIEDSRAEAANLAGLGRLRARAGDFTRAISQYEEALAAQRAGSYRRGELQTLNAIGRLQLESANVTQAASTLETALALAKDLAYPGLEGETLRNLGLVHERAGDVAQANARLDEALGLFRQASDRSGEADALYHLARLATGAGELAGADTLVARAIELTESLRDSVAGLEFRSTFLATRRDYYGLAISNALRQSAGAADSTHVERAFVLSERAKARSLLDALHTEEISRHVTPELRARRETLQRRINATERTREALAERSPDSARLPELSTEIAELLAQYRDVQAAIRRDSPRYTALTEPAPLRVDELRSRVLDEDTLLIEFELGDEQSVAWVVTDETTRWYPLPDRETVEDAARRVHELFSTSHRREAARPASRAAAGLSEMILAPLADAIDRKRIVIVPDGALHYVPFAALPLARGKPLLSTHEVVTAASASVLLAQRAKPRRRHIAERAVAVFADPVFREDDERLDRTPVVTARTEHSDLVRSAKESGTALYQRLHHTADEADAIRALADREASFEAVGLSASRDVLLAADLSQFRILHFATHGILNSKHPELSGIVLSLVDANGARVDGFLRTHEIANLDLEAQLVVVSACRTAMGREIRGEGIVGLTRAFMYAGASSVLATLWDVRDTATAALMTRFYRSLLRDGASPPEALRDAQRWMRAQPGWQAPYFWAGFVLQGDWQ